MMDLQACGMQNKWETHLSDFEKIMQKSCQALFSIILK